MKKVFSILILLSLFLSPIYVNAAVTGFSFGGMVTAVYTCNTGLLVYLRSVKPPFVLPLMWFWGNLPFSSYIPPHPKQLLLGIAAPITVPCFVGYYPIGYGFPIEYHGSSK